MDKTLEEMYNSNNINANTVMQEIAKVRERLSSVNTGDMSDDEKEVYSQVVAQFLNEAEHDVNDAKKIPVYKEIDVQNRNEKLRSAIENIDNAISNLAYLDESLVDLDNNQEMTAGGNGGIPGVSLPQDEVDQLYQNRTNNVEQATGNETLSREQVADEIQRNYDRVTSVPALEDLREQKDVLALEDLREEEKVLALEDLREQNVALEPEVEINQEEPVFQHGASSYYDPQRPLISRFMRYFDASMPSNSFQAIDFGKHIFRYMLPNDRIPQDTESLMNMTRLTLQQRDGFTDKDFVRLVIDKVNDNPGLITFDMVADLVESDAYKNYGTTLGSELGSKQKFECWIRDKSVLKKIEDPVVCALNEESMKRVAAAIMPEKDKEKYFAKIDGKIKEFDDVCAQKLREDKSLITQLEANAREVGESGSRENALQKVRDMYGIICTPPFGALYGEKIDADLAAKTTIAEKNIAASGHVAYANMTLEALAKRGVISQKDLQKVTIDELPFKDKTQSQPELKKRGVAFYVSDVLKTAASSFVGATAFSVIGKICPPAAGIAAAALVAGTGFKAAREEYKKLDKNPEYTKLQKIRKAALKGTSAVVTKGIPALAAVALGPVARVFGAAGVAVRSFVEDIEHRAEIQRQNQQALEQNQDQLQQHEQGNQQQHKKGIKGFISDFVGGIKDKFNKTRESIKSLKGKDIGKSVAYGISKGFATYFGAQAGVGVGNALGDRLSAGITEIPEQQTDKMTTKEITNENMNDVGNTLDNTQIPSYADKYIAENPGAHYDENGWVQNADGSYACNENGQLFGNENRVFRDLYAHETLDAHGNIIDKPGYTTVSQNNTGISYTEPEVKATFNGRALNEVEEVADFKNERHERMYNELLEREERSTARHNEKMNKMINTVSSDYIRNQMLENEASLMKDFENSLDIMRDDIIADGRVTQAETSRYLNEQREFFSDREQRLYDAIRENGYAAEVSPEEAKYNNLVERENNSIDRHIDKISQSINKIDNEHIRNEMMKNEIQAMESYNNVISNRHEDILADGKISQAESMGSLQQQEQYLKMREQLVNNTIYENGYDYEPEVNADFSGPKNIANEIEVTAQFDAGMER